MCQPHGQGLFGNAVITEAAVAGSTDGTFIVQIGSEDRGWICVATIRKVSVCTTHLSTRGSGADADANDAQCEEFTAVLAARDEHAAVLAAGDINRRHDCAPDSMWARTDVQASKLPGLQHSYGSTQHFPAPQAKTLPAMYTDHDFLLTKPTK